MSLRSGPERGRASRWKRLRAIFTRSKPAAVRGQLPEPRGKPAQYPRQHHVELRFADGSARVIDPRSADGEALWQLADQLRQIRP